MCVTTFHTHKATSRITFNRILKLMSLDSKQWDKDSGLDGSRHSLNLISS
jgi:hypothetical protein